MNAPYGRGSVRDPDSMSHMQLIIRLLRETGGRWIGDIPEVPGVTVYGSAPEKATRRKLSTERWRSRQACTAGFLAGIGGVWGD